MADDKRIERIARAMAKRSGFDPDSSAYWGKPLQINSAGYIVSTTVVPLWHLFAREAALAVEAIDVVAFEDAE